MDQVQARCILAGSHQLPRPALTQEEIALLQRRGDSRIIAQFTDPEYKMLCRVEERAHHAGIIYSARIVYPDTKFRIGDRVTITRPDFRNPDLTYLPGTTGTISDIAEPDADDSQKRIRYTIEFDRPMGEREHLDYFPLFDSDLQRVER